ncbi:MAG: TIGR03943 family protein [Anaerolineae bacterium]
MQQFNHDTSTPVRTMDVVRVLVLFSLTAYFAYNIASGNLTNYINERFVWLSYVAVVIFFALGLADAYALMKRDQDNDAFRQFDHNRVTWPIIGFAAVPLLLGVLIPSQPLGAEAINGNISFSVASVDGAVTSSEMKAPLDRNVLDWLRIFSGTTTPSDYDGQPAQMIGFVYREPDFPEGHFMISRFTVACCVADASAFGIPVYAPEADVADGQWVQVNGTFAAGLFRDLKTPILQAEALEVVPQPDHPYLYS